MANGFKEMVRMDDKHYKVKLETGKKLSTGWSIKLALERGGNYPFIHPRDIWNGFPDSHFL